MSYRIKTVSAMTGIPRPTLLAWERRYQILDPERTASGYRMYSDRDVTVLRRLKSLVDGGQAISEAVLLVREGAALRDGATKPDVVGRLVESLVAFERAAADQTAIDEVGQLPFEAALDLVYLPILHEIGDRWAHQTVDVAQEHFASGWVGEQMRAVFHALGAGPVDGPTVGCALPPDEQHEFGLLAVAIKLALRGWRVTWLGAQLPVDDLCAYVARERPKLLCLSLVRQRPRDEVLAYARAVRAGAGADTRVFVGGPAVDGLQGLSTAELGFIYRFSELLAALGAP